MKVGSRATRYAISFKLESLIRAEWKLSPIINIFFLLLVIKLRSFGINKFKNFITALLHYSNSRKILVSHNDIRCLEVKISPWLKTSWLIANICENCCRKSLWVEILNLTIIKFETWVYITLSFVRIWVKVDV